MQHIKNFQLRSVFGIILIICFLSHCSSEPVAKTPSSPKVSGVLEEVNPSPEAPVVEESKGNPLVTNINEKLKALGYEALGLSFESDETLLLLGSVFDSPIAQNRKIKIVYTGLLMSYDAKHQSLTIGTSKNLASILSYIEKNVPKQVSELSSSAPQLEPQPTAEPAPSKVQPTPSNLKKGKGKSKGRVKSTAKMPRKLKNRAQRNLPKAKSAPAPISQPASSMSPATTTTVTTTTQPTEPSANEPEALPQDEKSDQEVPPAESVQEPGKSDSEPATLMPEDDKENNEESY